MSEPFSLIGNAPVRAAVENAVRHDRIPHAIIIEGDSGLGKHTLARYITLAAVCSGDEKPCNGCSGCRLAAAGTHPDIMLTEPEEKKKSITVGQIRELRSNAFVKPHMASRRVFLIDRADTMNTQAQNALLKVLEEPPGNAVFLLIAESKSAFLDTVVSRCVTLTLMPPEHGEALEFVLSTSGAGRDAAERALTETENNIGRALALLSGAQTDKAEAAAEDFLRLAFQGRELDMLKVALPLEKDRAGADAFLRALKYRTARLMRAESRSTALVRSLLSYYRELESLEQSLKTNINLPLLFCTAVCKTRELIAAGRIPESLRSDKQ